MNNQEFIDGNIRFFDQREYSLPLICTGAGTPTINFLVKWVSAKRVRLSWTQTIFTTTSQNVLSTTLPTSLAPVIQVLHLFVIGSSTQYHTGMINIYTNSSISFRFMGRLAASDNVYGSLQNATEYTIFPSSIEWDTA